MADQFSEFREFVIASRPIAAIVLGSGLDRVTADFPQRSRIEFSDIPGMPMTRVAGHRGLLCLHEIGGQTFLVFNGRLHFYEGHPWNIVERPIRVAHELGVRTLILTNASGGIGPTQDAGALMAIRGQISATEPDWWREQGLGFVGGTAPSPYSTRLLELLRTAARAVPVKLTEGVYAGVTGPCYETPAEIRALRVFGADAVGMSTVREAQAAKALGMEVAGISCVANRAAGLTPFPLSHKEVLRMVEAAAGQMTRLVSEFLHRLAQ